GVLDREAALGDGDLVARPQRLDRHLLPVDLGAVGAAQVADAPDAVGQRKLAVLAGDVGEAQTDVARLAAADDQRTLQKRNRVAAADGDQLSLVAGSAHDGPKPRENGKPASVSEIAAVRINTFSLCRPAERLQCYFAGKAVK